LNEQAAKLRAGLASAEGVVSAAAWDCLTARLLASSGFDSVVVSGLAVSVARLGLPDLGFLGLTDLVSIVGPIATTCGVPVVADADTGFGSTLNAIHAAWTLAGVGAAGMIVEDQVSPKRCGVLRKEIAPLDESVAKIRGLAAERPTSRFVVVARTDALTVLGIDAAIDRATRFLDAGADVAYIQGARSAAEIERVAAAVRGPLLHTIVPGSTHGLAAGDLRKLGYRWLVHASVAEAAVVEGVRSAARAALDGRSVPEAGSPAALGDLFGSDEWLALEERYSAETRR
jgi:2-methylisocitrate lyase-like PEP mutase family enzyme